MNKTAGILTARRIYDQYAIQTKHAPHIRTKTICIGGMNEYVAEMLITLFSQIHRCELLCLLLLFDCWLLLRSMYAATFNVHHFSSIIYANAKKNK